MSPDQCRAARAILGINQEQLSALSGVSPATIKDFERGHRKLLKRTHDDLIRALESQGIEFQTTDRGEGVFRVRSDS